MKIIIIANKLCIQKLPPEHLSMQGNSYLNKLQATDIPT